MPQETSPYMQPLVFERLMHSTYGGVKTVTLFTKTTTIHLENTNDFIL